MFLGLLLLQTIPWIDKYFGKVTIESILFHLNAGGGDSADPVFLLSYVKRFFWSFAVSVLLVCITIFLQKKVWKNKKIIQYACCLSCVIFCLSCVMLDVKYGVIDYIKTSKNYSPFIEENYVVSDTVVFPENKKNIIILMIESLDSSFTTTEVFPEPLTPQLKKIQDEHASFSLLRQTAGTGWTIASITGFLFGLPLKLPIEGNSYSGHFDTFLPGAPSLLDVLSQNGYSSHWIVGSDATFSGKNNLLSNHAINGHFFEKSDFLSLAASKGDTLDLAGWGVRDVDLYAYMPELISKIAENEAPFFLLIETVDTHNPSHVYSDGVHRYNDKRDAFVTADALAVDFVEWFKQQDFYEDTMLLIVGDHNYMNKELAGFELLANRTLYNVFINSDLPLGGPDTMREATMLDFAPTILEATGATLPDHRFGLGVSLVGPHQTLYELFGEEELARQLSQRSALYDTFFFEKEAVQ